MVHIRPEADLIGKVLPHALVLPDVLLAKVNEGGHAVALNLLLPVDADLLFDLQLHREAVGIPAGLSRNHPSLHRMVARNHILKGTGLHMSDVGLSVRRGRSVIEDIGGIPLVFRDGLFENPLGPPELLDLFLPLHKVHVGINFFKHIAALPLCPLPPAPGSPLTSGPLYRRIPHKSSRAKDAAPESARRGP